MLTYRHKDYIIINVAKAMNAVVAELADAQDLKSCGPYRPYRFDSGLRHHIYRGVEQPGSSSGS